MVQRSAGIERSLAARYNAERLRCSPKSLLQPWLNSTSRQIMLAAKMPFYLKFFLTECSPLYEALVDHMQKLCATLTLTNVRDTLAWAPRAKQTCLLLRLID